MRVRPMRQAKQSGSDGDGEGATGSFEQTLKGIAAKHDFFAHGGGGENEERHQKRLQRCGVPLPDNGDAAGGSDPKQRARDHGRAQNDSHNDLKQYWLLEAQTHGDERLGLAIEAATENVIKDEKQGERKAAVDAFE